MTTLEDADVNTSAMYDKEYIRTTSLDEQLDYVSFHMTQLVNEVLYLDGNFETLFTKKQIKDRSFGKVFLRDLIYSDALDNKGGDVDEDVVYSLGAFEGLSEDAMVPYIEKIKDGIIKI